jgi:hypothetical protein
MNSSERLPVPMFPVTDIEGSQVLSLLKEVVTSTGGKYNWPIFLFCPVPLTAQPVLPRKPERLVVVTIDTVLAQTVREAVASLPAPLLEQGEGSGQPPEHRDSVSWGRNLRLDGERTVENALLLGRTRGQEARI